MTFTLHQIFYDWFGLNNWLFRIINAPHGDAYDSFMLTVTELGNHHYITYYIAATVAVLALRLLMRGKRPWPVVREELRPSIALVLTLVLGYIVCAVTTHILKDMFSTPRPFIVFHDGVHMAGPPVDPADHFASLPSGHAATISFLVAAWWPMLSRLWQNMGLLVAFLVCWSRVALGMHMPADVVAGILVGVLSAALVRRFVNYIIIDYRVERLFSR